MFNKSQIKLEVKIMIKNKQKALNATIYTSGGILLLMNASAGVVSAAVDSSQNRTQESSIMPTAGLADISVLSDASLISTTGNNMTPNSDGNYDLSLKYSGKGLANVGLADKKVLVYSLPSELQGKVKSGAMIDIDAQLLPIVPADVPGVNVLFTTVETAVDVFAKAVSLVGIDISGLQTAIDDLKELKELGSYQATLPGVVSADGKTISVDFTQGLGNYVNQAYAALFGGLRDAVDGINSSNTVVNTALTVLKRSTTPLFDLIDEIGAGSSTVLNSALSANILGPTSGTLRATVSDPGTPTATVRAAVINNAVLSAEIISLIDQSGEPVTLNFPNDATDPLADYQVEIPKLDPAYAGDTSISGSVVINQPVPAGTSFEAIATLGDGSEVNGTVDASGNFVINTAALTKDEVVSVKIKATNGTYTKDGSPATLTVGAKDATTNPLENYVVAAPAVNPAYAGDTSVKGSVTLTQPVPEGTTFKAIVTLPDGSEVSGDVDGSGNFTVDTGELKEADNLSVKVVATNGENTKDSAPVAVTVQAGISTENPLANYVVAAPQVEKATAGDVSIKGSVSLNQPVPVGTTFEAVVTLPDGSEVKGDVNADGSFTVQTGELKEADVLSVKVTAKNDTFTKDSAAVAVTVQPGVATNPLENYVVASPVVDPATAGDTSVTGSVELAQPIPEGTTFKAIVTMPDGTEKSAEVGADGKFTVDTGELKEADNLTVKVVATNGENTKESAPVSVIVQAEVTAENPLKDYQVATPTIESAIAGDTSIKGSVILNQPIPEGTTFKAVATMTDGTEKTGTIDADGKFTIDTGTLNEGDVLSVKVTAENGAYTKDSASVSITVQPAAVVTNPLENYNVSSPTVNPVTEGDTSVTGKVIFEQPIPEGTTFEAVVTLPDGTQKTGSVDANGNFTVDTGTLNADETITVKVVAHNGDNQKESTPISVTVGSKIPDTNPLADYNVSTPVVNPATAGDTSISGKVTLTEPVPAGTTFEAVVTLADGSKVTGEVDADGNFTVNTGTLKAGDVLSVKITAHNGEYSKDSAAVPVTVSEKSEVNPLDKYDVAAPKVDKIIDGDTKVTGSVDLNQPVPAGTTFEVVVTLPDGTQKSVTLGADGKFSIDTGTLTGGKYVDVQVVAHNGEFEKSGPKVSVLVDPNLPVVTNPLDNYVVSPSVVNPIVDDDTKVTGSVDLNQPIPDGTTFEVVVILPDGSEKVGMIDANGKFSIDTGKLNKDDQVKVKVVAKNGQYTKDSNVVQVTVGAKDAGNNGGGNGNGNNGNGGTGGNNGNNNGNGGTDGNNGNNNGNGGTDGNNGNNNGSGGTGGNNGNTGNNSGSGNSGSGSNSGGTGTGDGLSGGSAGGMNASNPNGGSNSGSLGTDLMQRGAVGSSPTSTATGSQAASGKSSNSGLLPKAGEKTLGVASIGAMLLAAVAVMFKKIFKRKDS